MSVYRNLSFSQNIKNIPVGTIKT
nr:unnamed protein product [Callosobruchus chinensis]